MYVCIYVCMYGLPLSYGVPIGADVTMVSPLHTDGSEWARAEDRLGVALERAEREKERPELVDSPVLCLITLACEAGRGRCHRVASEMVIAVTATDSLAATLVDDALLLLDGHDGIEPVLGDIVWPALVYSCSCLVLGLQRSPCVVSLSL